MKAWIVAAMAGWVLTLGLLGSAQAQSNEDCVVTSVGNSIADQMVIRSGRDVRRAITPALEKYRLGCLARTINLGGFNRLSRWLSNSNILRILESLTSPGSLCQVVLDSITDASPLPSGEWPAVVKVSAASRREGSV